MEDLRKIPPASLIKQDECPVCGDSAKPVQLFPLQEQPVPVYMSRCTACLAASAESMPTAEHLMKVYDPTHYQATLTNISGLVEALARRVVGNFDLAGRESIHVLDYGGGNGKLAREVVRQFADKYPEIDNIRATVVDLYLEPATENIEFIHVDDFLKSNKSYDVILASAVLEHIPNLKFIFQRLMDAGTPGALFYARTPFEVPLAGFLPFMKINWPVHVHDLGADFWNRLVERRGDVSAIKSQTSIVESSFKNAFARTLIAHVLKFPSRIETSVLKRIFPYKKTFWKWVGGWEVFLKLNTK